MSIFRTIKKIRDCDTCMGEGKLADGTECPICEGTGKIDVYSRVSQTAATRAASATKELPPSQRAEARERLEDHEPEPPQEGKQLPKNTKQGKVGKGFIDEEQ